MTLCQSCGRRGRAVVAGSRGKFEHIHALVSFIIFTAPRKKSRFVKTAVKLHTAGEVPAVGYSDERRLCLFHRGLALVCDYRLTSLLYTHSRKL